MALINRRRLFAELGRGLAAFGGGARNAAVSDLG